VNNLIIKEADKILGEIIKSISQIYLKILHGDNCFLCGVASRKVRDQVTYFYPTIICVVNKFRFYYSCQMNNFNEAKKK